jgi:hypothetical protein
MIAEALIYNGFTRRGGYQPPAVKTPVTVTRGRAMRVHKGQGARHDCKYLQMSIAAQYTFVRVRGLVVLLCHALKCVPL